MSKSTKKLDRDKRFHNKFPRNVDVAIKVCSVWELPLPQ